MVMERAETPDGVLNAHLQFPPDRCFDLLIVRHLLHRRLQFLRDGVLQVAVQVVHETLCAHNSPAVQSTVSRQQNLRVASKSDDGILDIAKQSLLRKPNQDLSSN
jgi:hypothetical protein